ncbi:aminotransferase class V-fold PLP-dependent enzyme [Eubacterium aggregans]|uniref:aminotransferase class V-fold PLP-dependent enzyme n=1 Tax=Eubacterium aggregans TaxID=81409 RepID=UPI0023F53960|nr:aminotransferase class V-fold PLP-dependent enzyme [Eubacterium aggregans]MDD4692383.1 aminotransferase class V-fold PLP-dependent enzyme [Eubacterium aggregans]
MAIYMNNAATSWPKPPGVAQAMYESIIALPGAANRGGLSAFNLPGMVREALARVLGVTHPAQVVLTANATHALNLAIFGMALPRGAVVLTTMAEHNSVLRPLYTRNQKDGIRRVLVRTDYQGRVSLRDWRAALEAHHPAMVVFTHASNVTGAVNEVSELAALARGAGAVTLLDASQTAGWIPVKAEAWGMDMVAVTGHKYLLGPQGTGALYVAPGLALHPHLVGGTGIHSDEEEMPQEMPLHLEAGTPAEPALAGLLAALCWAEANPLDLKTENEKIVLTQTLLEEAGAEVVAVQGERMPVISFMVPGYSAEEAGDILSMADDIHLRTGLHCAPLVFAGLPGLAHKETIRISLSRFTTEAEIRELAQAVQAVAHVRV